MKSGTNKALVRAIFDELLAGKKSALLSRVAESATWTVMGTCPVSGTYVGRQNFYEKVLRPITSQLAGPVKPTVTRVLGEGDFVVLEWRGEGRARDGRPYNNTYCWVLRIREGEIVEGTIYSDTALISAFLGAGNPANDPVT